MSVTVAISGSGGGGYQRIVTDLPEPTEADLTAPVTDFTGPLSEWFDEYVFPESGSGKGGYDCWEAVITHSDEHPSIIGETTGGEG